MDELVVPEVKQRGERRLVGATSRITEIVPPFAVALLLFASWSSFPAAWSEQMTYGYFVAAYCLWQVWGVRDELLPTAQWRSGGALAGMLLSAGWVAAQIVGVRVGHQLLAAGILLAWAAAMYGRRGFDTLWPIGLIFMLAIPIWGVLLGPLQAMTVGVNRALIQLAGLHAELDGNRIHFQFGTIEVAQSCAGLSYFMSGLTISVIYAHQFLKKRRTRITAIAIAVALALVANWLRVFGLVVVGYFSRMKSSLMTEHALYGWLIFAVVISAFFLFTGRLEKQESHDASGSAGAVSRVVPMEAVSVSWLVVGRCFLVVASPLIAFQLLSARSINVPLSPDIPGVVVPAGWTVRQLADASTSDTSAAPAKTARWSPALIGAQHRWSGALGVDGADEAHSVQIDRFGYNGARQGHELIGYPNAIANDDELQSDNAVGPLDQQFRMVRQAIVRAPGGARLVWYWYRVAGVETPSPARAKLLELAAFFLRNSPSELIAVSAPCGENDCQVALESVHLVVTGRTVQNR